MSIQSKREPLLLFSSFDFCQDKEEKRPSENLGQVLFGERIASSPYKVILSLEVDPV